MDFVRFLAAAGKHWWTLMGCAVFTFIGMLAVYHSKSDSWLFNVDFIAAGVFLFWGCFLAWRDEHRRANALESQVSKLEVSASIPPVQNIYFPPAPITPKPAPIKHNVRCVGIEITPDFPVVLMCFRNEAIPGKPVGRFKAARLKVNYFLESTGEEVAEIFPARWSGFPDQDEIEIGVTKVCAVLAMNSLGPDAKWEACSTKGIPAEVGWKYVVERVTLPSERLKIVANLIGENNLSMDKPITGILALGDDRTASFSQLS